MNTSRLGVGGVSGHRRTRLAGALALALAMGVASGAGAATGSGQTAGVAPPATNTKVEDAKAAKRASVKQHTATLQTVMVTAYVPRATNAAAKMEVPLLETPQSVTVIPRAQMNLLDWQNLDQAVRYTSGVVGGIFGPDPRYDWLNQRGFNPTVYINGL
jgi:iron complex outermembrane receptor protein